MNFWEQIAMAAQAGQQLPPQFTLPNQQAGMPPAQPMMQPAQGMQTVPPAVDPRQPPPVDPEMISPGMTGEGAGPEGNARDAIAKMLMSGGGMQSYTDGATPGRAPQSQPAQTPVSAGPQLPSARMPSPSQMQRPRPSLPETETADPQLSADDLKMFQQLMQRLNGVAL